MERNDIEKNLIKKPTGLFSRIRKFLSKVFNKKDIQQDKNAENKNFTNTFKDEIKVEEDKEKIRLLKIQEEFKNGNIEEEDISEDDYNKLLKLYDEQNTKLEQEIEMYRRETERIIKKMKNQ